jgi:hypothetical protein
VVAPLAEVHLDGHQPAGADHRAEAGGVEEGADALADVVVVVLFGEGGEEDVCGHGRSPRLA